MSDIADRAKESQNASWARWIGVYIGMLAVLLSIATMIGKNAEQDAAKANLDAANTWAFFQAKNIRREQFRVAAENMRIRIAENPEMPAPAKSMIEAGLAKYDKKIAMYTSDKKRNEGLDELWARAKALEKVRDDALARGPYFDYGEAFLQIAIVLASVAIVTGGTGALALSLLIGAAGIAAVANGKFMFATLPGL
ncbi:MAG: DUF4337 domain-containing protein [Hyphomicrobiaceae bacterium]